MNSHNIGFHGVRTGIKAEAEIRRKLDEFAKAVDGIDFIAEVVLVHGGHSKYLAKQ